MNYYEHHIGDYAAATSHLSLVEDAIYTRMLRRYYLQEGPLPVPVETVARLIGAREEVETVRAMLLEFFTLADDGWHQKRCDEDIVKFRERMAEADAGRENETERKRRYRERRADLFDQLRAIGVVPRFDTPTEELVRLLSRGTGAGQGVGRDAGQDGEGTATHTPNTTHQTPKEKHGRGKRASAPVPVRPDDVDEQTWGDWLLLRKAKNAPVTETVLRGARAEAAKAEMPLAAFLAVWCRRGSQGLEAAWLKPHERAGPPAANGESRTLTGMKALQGMKDGLVHTGNDRRPDAAHVAVVGSDAPRRLGTDHGRDLD